MRYLQFVLIFALVIYLLFFANENAKACHLKTTLELFVAAWYMALLFLSLENQESIPPLNILAVGIPLLWISIIVSPPYVIQNQIAKINQIQNTELNEDYLSHRFSPSMAELKKAQYAIEKEKGIANAIKDLETLDSSPQNFSIQIILTLLSIQLIGYGGSKLYKKTDMTDFKNAFKL